VPWAIGRRPRKLSPRVVRESHGQWYNYRGRVTTRCLRQDFTLVHQGGLYQIHDSLRATHVLVEEPLDGTMRITHQGRPLGFHAITSRPVKAVAIKPVPLPRRPVTPRPDHPWRKRLLPEQATHAAAGIT